MISCKMLVRKTPGAWPSTSAWAARGYRRFSRIPAERRNLLWKLNIVKAVIWAFILNFAILASLSLALMGAKAPNGPGF